MSVKRKNITISKMYIFYSIYLAPILGIFALVFTKQKWVRVVILASFIFVGLSRLSDFWTNEYLISAGCGGNVMKGLSCPEMTKMVRLAILHQLSFLVSVFFVAFICPILALFIVVSEWNVRQKTSAEITHDQ
ncbi:hypothetical protein J7399_14785 [Shimia sp. R9_1]|nr:hypothetical protein [Shimia sp. R9_1]